ncbi:MAG TPA: YggS family pyridoxal phosphate-dependent enzyme [Betaproteobacteria bacterium]|nr:YggS family pyridoxal phosphate-dependent enzyme [Betaproteobacteria bacterium]
MTTIASALTSVKRRIAAAAEAAHRSPDDIQLLAVSKTWPAAAVAEAARTGQRAFGESYLQEALDKIEALRALALEWHFIGPIQRNKTRPIAENFAWAHSVDRLNIAQRLNDARPPALPPLNVCLQVNVSGEATKSGVDPETLPALARAVAALPRLTLRGLMTIPRPAAGAAQRAPFQQLRQLRESLMRQGFSLDTLSMGMSSDLDAAVAEGATIVRVGTAIFGARQREDNQRIDNGSTP